MNEDTLSRRSKSRFQLSFRPAVGDLAAEGRASYSLRRAASGKGLDTEAVASQLLKQFGERMVNDLPIHGVDLNKKKKESEVIKVLACCSW